MLQFSGCHDTQFLNWVEGTNPCILLPPSHTHTHCPYCSANLDREIRQDEQKLETNKGILQQFRARSNEKVSPVHHSVLFSCDSLVIRRNASCQHFIFSPLSRYDTSSIDTKVIQHWFTIPVIGGSKTACDMSMLTWTSVQDDQCVSSMLPKLQSIPLQGLAYIVSMAMHDITTTSPVWRTLCPTGRPDG